MTWPERFACVYIGLVGGFLLAHALEIVLDWWWGQKEPKE